MAAPGATMVYSFTYRGNVEEWTQQYHIVGDAPSDDAGWISLFGAFKGLVVECLSSAVKIVRMYGYENTDDDSVFTYDAAAVGDSGTGVLSASTGLSYAPGDAAAWVRWKTARVNTHGKPIYLRKYFHGCILAPADQDTDALGSGYKAALEAFGTAVAASSGAWPGLAGPDGVAPGAMSVSPFVTTRTLKRRGARP